MSEAEAMKSDDKSTRRLRRHRTDDLIATLGAARERDADRNVCARLDTVLAVLKAGASHRKTIVLPDGGSLLDIEIHLGVPDEREDAAAWKRLRREHDERVKADMPAAIYTLAQRENEPAPSRWTRDQSEPANTSPGTSAGRTRT